jgi:hypothetical protein
MDWATLISVVIGGLIATIPVLISNRFQAKERDKDRQEQRREAKIQLALERMKNKIKFIEDRIDTELRAVDTINTLALKEFKGELSHAEMRKQLDLMYLEAEGRYAQVGEMEIISDKWIDTLGEDFHAEFRKFDDLCYEFWKMSVNSPYVPAKVKKARLELSTSAAKLINMLDERLISIRE